MLFIFDMGGVVTTTFNMNGIYEELGISKEKFFEICGHNNGKVTKKDIWNLYETGKIDVNEFWKIFNHRGKKYNLKPVQNDLFRMFFHPVLNEKTVDLIKKLRKNHRVVCGTNTIQSHWENHLERGDYAFFDQTYASNKIGEAKPDVSFFEIILKAEGYEAKDAFFTDDKIENVEAARAAGLNAVNFTNAEELTALWEKYC